MILALPLFVMVQTTAPLKPVEIRPGQLVLAGSPDAATLASLKTLGITHVINLRHPAEGNFSSDVDSVRSSGAAYFSCPLDREPSFNGLDSFRVQMSALPPGSKVLVHCATGNRAAGALFAYWALDQGMAEGEALALARKAGLRNPATEAAVQAYVTARRSPAGRNRFSREDSE